MSYLAIHGGAAVRTAPWPAWPQHGAAVQEAIRRVAATNCYHPQFGPEVVRFEESFAAFHGVGHAAGAANGTLALQLAMAAAGVGCGDEVLVPAYTYVASASAAVDQNAVPVFVDSEPLSQGLDPQDVRRKLTPRTKAIVVVHTNGYPCDMDGVMDIATERGLVVVEDCSHAHGAFHRKRRVGTIGHIGAFSLQHKKNLSAGVGGVAITNDETLGRRMRDWRNFTFDRVGHNWLMSEFHAAIAAAQLPALDEMNDRRRANVKALLEALGVVEGVAPLPGLPDTEPVYYNLILQYDERIVGASRRAFVAALKAEGIPIHMFYVPLQRWPTFAEADFFGRGCPFTCPLRQGGDATYSGVETPVAAALCDRVNLEIKVHPTSGETEMRHVAEAIHKLLSHRDELRRVDETILSKEKP